MSNRLAIPASVSSMQAAKVLRAWVVADEPAFRAEIRRTLELCSAGEGAFEEENILLLKAVAEALKRAPLNAECESMVHLCINLLIHIASHSLAVSLPVSAVDARA
jgi:hypothetical protein